MSRVVDGATAGHDHILPFALDEIANEPRRLGRRRDHTLRMSAEAQTHRQHVPSFGREAPSTDLVTPSRVVLWAAQPLRFISGEQRRNRTIRPGQLPLDGSNSGRHQEGAQERIPAAPSTITERASWAVAPTRAMRRAPLGHLRKHHSAPLRVLPKPRPASSSHMRQSPGGANCSGRATTGHACSREFAIWPKIAGERAGAAALAWPADLIWLGWGAGAAKGAFLRALAPLRARASRDLRAYEAGRP